MNPKAIQEIDQQINQLEKQLHALYSKRVAALESEIKRSQALLTAFNGSAAQADTPVAKAPAAPRVKTKGRARRKQAAIARPAQPEVEQPQTAEVPNQQSAKTAEEAPSAAPGRKGRGRKAKQAKQPKQPKQAKKRTRTPTAVVEKRIVDALKEAGAEGLSQIEVSKKAGLGYQTVVKKLKELPGIDKRGSGRDGRYYLKD